ncbi:MAG TPA: MBL fold metallo-hydrolase [Mycobacteriales bacterium]|nr:MBL fold metallo-hydrolase [Mycobacteriales bacterium]
MTESDSLLFIGTATTLIRYAGFTVLTDPNFLHRGQRAYLGRGLWSKRRTEPALGIRELPPLDLVVLSHLHGDHFDRVARQGLDHGVPIATTPHAGRRLAKWGFTPRPLETWQSTELTRDGTTLRVTSLPGRHALGPARRILPPVMGSLLEFTGPGRPPLRLYLSGDTLYYDGLREIRDRYSEVDLGVLHLGGTKILGMTVTMDGRQGVDLLHLLRPDTAVGIHHDDYGVFRSPLSDFLAEARRRPPGTRVLELPRGGALTLPVPPDA